MAVLNFDSPATQWLRAAARVADWLEPQLDDKGRLRGELHDLGSYYKWPLFLWSLGCADLAEQLFHVIVADFMTADGDFRTGEEKSADPIYGMIADSYTNTWPIVAARVLERKEVGQVGLDCLRSRRVEKTEGFLTGRSGQHADERQDIVTIAGCGNALLAWEEVEEAKRAGECLLRVLEMQEGTGDPFYLYIDGEGELLTDLEIPERLQRIHLDRPNQAYVYLGMSAVFLARLFAVTGEERFLEGAQGYFAINMACGDRVYQGIGCCKTGWSAATLYRLTGEEQYRQSVRKAGAEILSLQQAGGDWKLPDASGILECDVNGELGYHLTQYCLELAGGGME
jgi:hypothetical protein